MAFLVWDADDVLNESMRHWLTHEQARGNIAATLRYEEIAVNPPQTILGWEMQRYLDSLDAFRELLDRDFEPRREILDWFQVHGARHDHVILTARPVTKVASLSAWAFRWFAPWLRGFHFVPSPRHGQPPPEWRRTKAQVLTTWNTSPRFIDDSTENIDGARAAGIPSFLFPAPWNAAAASGESSVARLDEWIKATEKRGL